jgi:predicted house-cleaning noncanonical NTP pyrophosphatase (MazG superfamily)
MKEKLVRDKIADFVFEERGEILNTRIASSKEIKQLLLDKILEEAQEVYTSQTKENLAEELGDLLEVIKALTEIEEIAEELVYKRELKFSQKGGFSKGLVLITDCKK